MPLGPNVLHHFTENDCVKNQTMYVAHDTITRAKIYFACACKWDDCAYFIRVFVIFPILLLSLLFIIAICWPIWWLPNNTCAQHIVWWVPTSLFMLQSIWVFIRVITRAFSASVGNCLRYYTCVFASAIIFALTSEFECSVIIFYCCWLAPVPLSGSFLHTKDDVVSRASIFAFQKSIVANPWHLFDTNTISSQFTCTYWLNDELIHP